MTAVNASAGVTTIKGETYFQVVARSTSAGTGLFPIGGNILVAGGERYLIRAKGYQTGYAPAYIQAKTNGTTIDWSYSALPNREGTESWTEQVITIPAGHTVLQVGITWPAPPIGHTYYLNEFEVIKLSAKVPEYQYHLKDHLGNVRMTFTTKDEADSAKATLEASHAVAEGSSFLNYDKARLVYGSLFDSTNGTSPGYAQRLSGAEGEKIGLAKSFSVMPGDTIRAEVFAKYFDVPSDPCVLPTILQTLLANLVNPGGSGGSVVDGNGYGTSSALSIPGLGGYGEQEDEDVPKAFLNYIYINRDFDLGSIRTKYTPITEAALEDGTDGPHELLSIVDTVKEAGYVYVYLSNDGEEVREVYFDDFKVGHIKSPVIESQDYFPFGLMFNNYSRENSLTNRFKFQSQEHIDDLGLNWDAFKWRNHQPEIGRFFNVDPLSEKYYYYSPYAFSGNQVTSHRELEGLEPVDIKQDETKRTPPPQQKGKPESGKAWTGFDGLNFTQGMAKEGGGSQSGMGVLLHSSEGGGPDEQYLKKADPMATLLDMDKDGLDAMMSIAKTMPKGGKGFGESTKNAMEGVDKVREMDESGQEVTRSAVNEVRTNNTSSDQQQTTSEPMLLGGQMEQGKSYYCTNCTTKGDTVHLNAGMNSNDKNRHNGYIKEN